MEKLKFKKIEILPKVDRSTSIIFEYQIFGNESNNTAPLYKLKLIFADVLLNLWKVDEAEIKKLTFPFAIEYIKELFKNNMLKDELEKTYTTGNISETYPYKNYDMGIINFNNDIEIEL